MGIFWILPYEAFVFDTVIHDFPVHQHWHHYMEVLYMLEGSTEVTCDREVYHLNPGDMIALLPKKLHSIGGFHTGRKRYFVLKFDLNRFHDTSGIMPQLKSSILQAGHWPESHHTFSDRQYGRISHWILSVFLLPWIWIQKLRLQSCHACFPDMSSACYGAHMERQWLYTAHDGYAARGRLYWNHYRIYWCSFQSAA